MTSESKKPVLILVGRTQGDAPLARIACQAKENGFDLELAENAGSVSLAFGRSWQRNGFALIELTPESFDDKYGARTVVVRAMHRARQAQTQFGFVVTSPCMFRGKQVSHLQFPKMRGSAEMIALFSADGSMRLREEVGDLFPSARITVQSVRGDNDIPELLHRIRTAISM